MIEFKLPDIGEGVAEGEIVKWLVAEGAAVEEHQAVVEVMTDKATVEIPAPASGVIVRRLVEAGATVPVGDVIFQLQTSAAAPAAASAAAPQPAPVAAAVAVHYGKCEKFCTGACPLELNGTLTPFIWRHIRIHPCP